MPTRKPKPTPPSPLALGFTKEELAAVVITAGVFSGPYGKTVMESEKPLETLAMVAQAALSMYDVLLQMTEARHAA